MVCECCVKHKEISKSKLIDNLPLETYESETRWYLHWRHASAYVFLLICLFDFIVMPIIYESNDKIDPIKAVELSLKFNTSETQNIALQTILSKRSWEPLTLKSGGIFFAAFGAILGVAAWSRGIEKVEKTKRHRMNRSDNP